MKTSVLVKICTGALCTCLPVECLTARHAQGDRCNLQFRLISNVSASSDQLDFFPIQPSLSIIVDQKDLQGLKNKQQWWGMKSAPITELNVSFFLICWFLSQFFWERTLQQSRESRCHWVWRSRWRVPLCLQSDPTEPPQSPLIGKWWRKVHLPKSPLHPFRHDQTLTCQSRCGPLAALNPVLPLKYIERKRTRFLRLD